MTEEEATELAALKAKVAEYENAITWGVSCLGCSRQLDELYAERAKGYEEGVTEGRRLAVEEQAQRTATERTWVFPMNSKADVVMADGYHRYWSTHCRHDNHSKCSAMVGDDKNGQPFARRPAQCQRCAAPCICPCHAGEVQGGQ